MTPFGRAGMYPGLFPLRFTHVITFARSRAAFGALPWALPIFLALARKGVAIMKIAPKILAPVIGLSVTMAVNVGFAFWLSGEVASAQGRAAQAEVEALNASEVRALSRAIQRDTVKLASSAWREAQQKLDASVESRATALLARARKLADLVDPANVPMHRDFVALQETVTTEIRAVKAGALAGDYARANEDFVKRVEPAEKAASKLTDAFIEDAEKRVAALTAEVANVQAFAQKALVGVSAVSLLAALGLSLAIVFRGVAGPLLALAAAMRRLVEGEFDLRLPGLGRADEIGEIAKAVELFKAQAIDKARRESADQLRRQQADAAIQAEIAADHARIAAEQAAVMKELGEALSRLAEKDLTYRIVDDMPAAYLRLRDDFNSAIGHLEGAMTDVAGAVEAISAATQDIASASDDLARRTEQQAAALEETAATMAEITLTVTRSAEGAGHASETVAATKIEAKASGEIVGRAIDAMSRIEKSAQEISQIITVIDEIAFQTNLLALNAGVEAARAGEAGKGFAVVASEVRALAQRAAQAAKEIKGLITASTGQVEHGVDFVNRTGGALETIAAQVMEIDRVVAEIASGAGEQAASLGEVNSAVAQMDRTTQQNAAMVEETTAASHSLRQEVEVLSGSVGSFRISSARRGRPTASAGPRVALKTVAGRSGGAVRKPAVDAESWAEF